MNLFQLVDGREHGALPVSIGTSLALESAFGRYPEKPVVTPPPIAGVDLVMMNLRTLFRNLLGAIDRTYVESVMPKHLLPALSEETTILEASIKEETAGKTQVVFYYSDYAHLTHQTFKGALFREIKTPKQMAMQALEGATFDQIAGQEIAKRVLHFEGPLQGRYPRTLIITHCPVDLLAYGRFSHVDLLESHTGTIKPRALWGTKLTGQRESVHLPLMAFTLSVFGDGVHFSSQRPTLKNAVLDVATLDHWTGLSTQALVKNSITKIKDPNIREELLGFW